ncbi:MAG: hypothetical protein L3J28_15370, partial [Candidatus Polarisedimenticolaceae bacterium]|nr:hypothetical protein [Candidatus Polarisedimenticolaceae bacterium]
VKDVVFLARCIFECQKTPTILEYPYALGCFFEHVIFYVGIWVCILWIMLDVSCLSSGKGIMIL